jgi:hypothetical protein
MKTAICKGGGVISIVVPVLRRGLSLSTCWVVPVFVGVSTGCYCICTSSSQKERKRIATWFQLSSRFEFLLVYGRSLRSLRRTWNNILSSLNARRGTRKEWTTLAVYSATTGCGIHQHQQTSPNMVLLFGSSRSCCRQSIWVVTGL